MNKKLTVKSKIAYGIGDMALCLTTGVLAILYMKFLTDYQGLNPFIAGLVIALARVWDGISDPIMGYIADRTKTRMGSYRPYLLFGAVPFALSFLAMWYIPDFTQTGKLIYYALMYILFDTCLTVVFIPYVSLTTRITNDYDERTSITSYRMVFSLSASMIANVVPLMIIGPMKMVDQVTNEVTYASSTSIWLVVGTIAVISVIVFLITALGTRELPYEAPKKTSIKDFVKIAIKNKPYLLSAGMYLMVLINFELVLGSALYYFENALGIYNSSVYIALIFVFSLISVPTIWDKLAKKFDKTTAFIIGCTIRLIPGFIIAFIPRDTSQLVLFVLFAVSGIGVGALQSLPWAIIPDSMDYSEYKYGERNDAMMYSVMTSFKKLISAITPLIIGAALTIGNYNPDLAVQPTSANLAIRFVIAVIPSLCIIVAIVMAAKYPLKRADFEMINRELERRKNKVVDGGMVNEN